MNKAILTVGISCSGKSTFARKWVSEKTNRTEINRDVIRAFLVEDVDKNGPFTWAKWKWNREKTVTEEADKLLARAVKHGFDVIYSDTNLNPKYRAALIAKLQSYEYDVEVMDFDISIEEAWRRDAQRINGVGHTVIASQHEQWLGYARGIVASAPYHPTYVPDITKPKCILVDIDGTLAHMNGKRSAFAWDKVHLDDVDDAVRTIVNQYYWSEEDDDFVRPSDSNVIVLSGRDGCCYKDTYDWLVHNHINFTKLIMRTPGDMRKDTIVKEEIFWRDIADNYNVQFVIDDRPCVIRLWQSIGLKTFIVGNPWIEF